MKSLNQVALRARRIDYGDAGMDGRVAIVITDPQPEEALRSAEPLAVTLERIEARLKRIEDKLA